MDETTRRKVLKKIQADITGHEAEIRKLRDFAAYISDEAPPEPVAQRVRAPRSGVSARSPSGPTLKERVKNVFANIDTDQDMLVPQVADGLRNAGWDSTSENATAMLRRTLRELADEGFLLRPDDRRYRIAAPTLAVAPEVEEA